MSVEYNSAVHRFAVVTAAATAFLLMAGALVTSNDAGLAVPDWPLSYGSLMPPMVGGIFWEHGHRMIATTIGFLTIVLTVWLWRSERRRWLRWLGVGALVAVILQGVLGGLTVIFLLPVPVSIAHACLAQLFFSTVLSIALFTSRWWLEEMPALEDTGSPAVRSLALATTLSIFVQLALGAAFRHKGLSILPHILWAVVVMGMVIVVSRAVRKRFANVAGLRRPALYLSALVGTQILLGIGAYLAVRYARDFPQPILIAVVLTVAHVLVGALTLATSAVLTICSFRLIQPASVAERAGAPVLREGTR